jgi:hypothetical protein
MRRERRPGGGGAAHEMVCAHSRSRRERPPQAPPPSCAQRADPRFRRLVAHIHDLGPRATGELLLEIGRAYGIEDDIARGLEIYGEIDPELVVALGADRWPPPPIHVVTGG